MSQSYHFMWSMRMLKNTKNYNRIQRFKDILAFVSIVIEFETSFNDGSSSFISTFVFSSMSSSSIGMELSCTSLQFGSLFYALFSLFLFASFSLLGRMYLDVMTFLPLLFWHFLSPVMLINLRSLQIQLCIYSKDNCNGND